MCICEIANWKFRITIILHVRKSSLKKGQHQRQQMQSIHSVELNKRGPQLHKSRNLYICKVEFESVDQFYSFFLTWFCCWCFAICCLLLMIINICLSLFVQNRNSLIARTTSELLQRFADCIHRNAIRWRIGYGQLIWYSMQCVFAKQFTIPICCAVFKRCFQANGRLACRLEIQPVGLF